MGKRPLQIGDISTNGYRLKGVIDFIDLYCNEAQKIEAQEHYKALMEIIGTLYKQN